MTLKRGVPKIISAGETTVIFSGDKIGFQTGDNTETTSSRFFVLLTVDGVGEKNSGYGIRSREVLKGYMVENPARFESNSLGEAGLKDNPRTRILHFYLTLFLENH